MPSLKCRESAPPKFECRGLHHQISFASRIRAEFGNVQTGHAAAPSVDASLLAIAHLGHTAQQRIADLLVACGPGRGDCCRSRDSLEGGLPVLGTMNSPINP